MIIKNRVPRNFFITTGKGESDITVHAGSYHLALKAAGIEMCNIMNYSSILPSISEQIPYPKDIVHGQVLEVISAEATVEEGERATAAIVYAWLMNKETNVKYGGIVCEYNGKKTIAAAKKELLDSIMEIWENGFSELYELKDINFICESFIPSKKFGTAIVAICFVDFEVQEVNP